MSCPIDLSTGTLSVRVRLGPGNCIRYNHERSGISIAPIRVRRTYTLPTNHRKIYALHIYLYFQPWIFSHREPHRCPSLESSGWLKTLSSAVLHLEKIDKGAEIGATLIESFFYCYCVENHFVMSTVVPDTALLSLFSSSLPFYPLISLSEPFLIFRSPSQGPRGVKSIMKWVPRPSSSHSHQQNCRPFYTFVFRNMIPLKIENHACVVSWKVNIFWTKFPSSSRCPIRVCHILTPKHCQWIFLQLHYFIVLH